MPLAVVQDELLKGFRYPALAAVIALAVSWLLTPWVRSLAVAQGRGRQPQGERPAHPQGADAPLGRAGDLRRLRGLAAGGDAVRLRAVVRSSSRSG